MPFRRHGGVQRAVLLPGRHVNAGEGAGTRSHGGALCRRPPFPRGLSCLFSSLCRAPALGRAFSEAPERRRWEHEASAVQQGVAVPPEN